MRTSLQITLAATAVGFVIGVVRSLRGVLDRALDAADPPSWLVVPGLTLGEAVTVYLSLAELASFLASTVLVLAIGYVIGRRFDLAEILPALIGALAVGGFLGVLLGGLAVQAGWQLLDASPGMVPVVLALLSPDRFLEIVLVGVAGAALAHFDAIRGLPPLNTDGAAGRRWLTFLPVALIGLVVLGKLAVVVLIV